MSITPPADAVRAGRVVPLVAAVCIVAIGVTLSLSATLTKSATVDEPLHFAAAYAHTFLHDFRIDVEDPPLWQRVAMLPIRRSDLTPSTSDNWTGALADYAKSSEWWDETLFGLNGDQFPSLLNRSRCAMVGITAILISLTIAVGWRLAGPAAGLIAGVMLALDPLILGHGSLVKNDVAISLCFLAAAAASIAVIRRMTCQRAIAFTLVVGIAPTIKFTGTLVLPLVSVTLLVRALTSETWPVFSRAISSRIRRLVAALCLIFATALATWFLIWAAYGFRFAPTPDSDRLMNSSWFYLNMAVRQVAATTGKTPTRDQLIAWRADPASAAMGWCINHALLPDAFCIGFLHTRAFAATRASFLMGTLRETGCWYYFPATILFKTPTASLAAIGIALLGAIVYRRLRHALLDDRPLWVAGLVFLVIGGGYLAFVMSAALNLGLRHVMPLYPIMYIAVGIVFTIAARHVKRRNAQFIGALLLIGLAAETLSTWPNYIAFFNAPSGGSVGGLRLLGDSNLDWNQDFTGLAKWQQAHPAERLYFASFGGLDPAVYGIRYFNLPGGYWRKAAERITPPCVVAISSNDLQGLYLSPALRKMYDVYNRRVPREIIGGTLYLYDEFGQ